MHRSRGRVQRLSRQAREAERCGAVVQDVIRPRGVLGATVCRAPTTKPLKGALMGGGSLLLRAVVYGAKAAKARAVISSTLPVPLMARYLGADAASALAQLE